MSYDSRPDTYEHISLVRANINRFIRELLDRGHKHDNSKLRPPEVAGWDAHSWKLKDLEYGTPEYRESLAALNETVRLHYSVNRHHPEYWEDAGINGMTLVDLIEMLADWEAAGRRMGGSGDIRKSLEVNAARFGMSKQLVEIFANTIDQYWPESGSGPWE